MNIRILPEAERDLELGADYYESQRAGLGHSPRNNHPDETQMSTRSNSPLTYRNLAVATLLIGIVLAVVGFAMGGSTSVTWAGCIGAGIALMLHGCIASIGSFLTSSRHGVPDQYDAK